MGREHHGTNCAYRANPDEPCTCGVTERTEREMHAAWRKRAEEAETALAAMTAERDGLRDAARAACRMAYRASYLGFDRAWVEGQINGIQNRIVREQMQAISMGTAAKGVE